jgi:cyclopropane-fatty-acyl-phospholipid synthase
LTYSCAWWVDDPADTLRDAQHRKLDFFAEQLDVAGARVLDIGSGWGAMLDRFVRVHGAAGGTGLTMSSAQFRHAGGLDVPGVTFLLRHWASHPATERYDAICCIEATEHFASDRVDADTKVQIYRDFFEHCAGWLPVGGRLGLQLICLDNVGFAGSRAGRGPLSELIRTVIFPESMPASLGELVLGWERHFRLSRFDEHTAHYVRTFRAWDTAERAHRQLARSLIGDGPARAFEQYFAVGRAIFRLREQALYGVILERRPPPLMSSAPLQPADLAPDRPAVGGASTAAVRAHYDISNDFYRLWLGPTMMYSSGRWDPDDRHAPLEDALDNKIDTFVRWTGAVGAGRLLDVGCGWGHTARRAVERHGVGTVVGLTPSRAQHDFMVADNVGGVEPRCERWEEHSTGERYDAVLTFGAFEHFAPDGSTAAQRVHAYRHFFRRCFDWLPPGGRLGMETIAHDDAPDTTSPLGRGPLGDIVLGVYPESLCPNLSEIVLGFEPWFEVRRLESAADDFARTMKCWAGRFRNQRTAVEDLVGPVTARRFWQYLVASDVQFRLGVITNYRVVLRRRPTTRW